MARVATPVADGSLTRQELRHEVENHVWALHNRGLPRQVGEYNNDDVMAFTVLPGIEGIGRIFEQYGDD